MKNELEAGLLIYRVFFVCECLHPQLLIENKNISIVKKILLMHIF